MAQRPNLETVTEEGEEETPSKEKDSKGQTELHRLAAQEGKIISLDTIGYLPIMLSEDIIYSHFGYRHEE